VLDRAAVPHAAPHRALHRLPVSLQIEEGMKEEIKI
jgi:hypothetical protein